MVGNISPMGSNLELSWQVPRSCSAHPFSNKCFSERFSDLCAPTCCVPGNGLFLACPFDTHILKFLKPRPYPIPYREASAHQPRPSSTNNTTLQIHYSFLYLIFTFIVSPLIILWNSACSKHQSFLISGAIKIYFE